MRRFLAIPAILILGLFQRSSPGQQSDLLQVKGQTLLQHEVTVALKLVQVYVTDKRGNPVPDLRREEFFIYDNKDEKQITEFEKYALFLPGTAAPAPAAELVETPLSSSVPLLNRKFFLLFDLVFTQEKGFRIARSAALQFIETGLVQTDEASVLLFSGGRSLDVRMLPTRGHDAVRSAVESLTIANLLNRVFNEAQITPPTQVLSGQDAAVSNFRPSSGDGPSEIRILAGNFIWALKSFAQALRTQPGQKHVILYSKGIASATIGRGQAGGTYSELSRGYADMCKELAAAGVSVFPVNTADPDALKMTFGTGETTLRETAASTGGRYLGFAVNAEKHMETVNNITGMYYVLGYPIGQTWDGKFHSVRVKVNRPDCDVHAQPGYFNPKPFTDYSRLEKEIHLVDLALSGKPLSQDPERFVMQALPIASKPPDNVVFVVGVPKEKLTEIEGPRVEVSSFIFNALDEITDSRRTEIDLESSRLKRDSAFFLTALSAPPGKYKSRVVLRNLETGRAAVAGIPVVVPEVTDERLVVYPPLLASEGEEADYLGESQSSQQRQSAAGSRATRAFPFDPKKYVPYTGNQLEAGSEITAAVRCSAPGDDLSVVELTAKLISQDSGTEQDIEITMLDKRAEKNGQMFLVRLKIPYVTEGLYRMTFIVSDSRSGLSSQVTRNFSIK